jgi:phosphatidylserine/phosphatidylglycerophosphate/cardiolipin synthase-like enzyme
MVVVVTDLRRLRDSNPVYCGFWRVCAAPFGAAAHGIFPHPFDPKAPGVGLCSWLSLLNFKANHRKILVTDAPRETGGRQLVSLIASANPHNGSSVDLAMFYLSERRTLDALASAAGRGVDIRLLLDPNRDAFGYRKNGIPNRPVAAELLRRGQGRIAVRWYDTHGEQFHDKLVLIRQRGQTTLLLPPVRRPCIPFPLAIDAFPLTGMERPVDFLTAGIRAMPSTSNRREFGSP